MFSLHAFAIRTSIFPKKIVPRRSPFDSFETKKMHKNIKYINLYVCLQGVRRLDDGLAE